ncbi:glycosyltransferase family 39 protein [Streptomyces sp. NBC_01190]|uniref:glycosyltransferase family 39 protein n=1 Tax=Streptomyces sp. NBC_01190 TaxID=2903767 RepID=UPI003870DB8A|nr:glycosyltransferase family 39 protein [Streptomyces sp. NBC_01190]
MQETARTSGSVTDGRTAPGTAPGASPAPDRPTGPSALVAWAAHRPGGQATLLLVLAAGARAPSFRQPFWSPDEGYLAAEAVALRHGGRMYGDVVDRKPPLLPWLYEGCVAIAGSDALWLVRLLAVAALALTAVVTARLAARLLGGWAALPAGVLTVAASTALPAPDAMAATFEIFMLPATALAVYFGVRRDFLAAGLAVAVAALTKQVGLAPLLPLALHVLAGRRRLREGAALAAGVATPLVVCALATGVRPFVFWVLLSSGSYAGSPPEATAVFSHAAGNLLLLLTAFAPFVVLAAPWSWPDPRRWTRRPPPQAVHSPGHEAGAFRAAPGTGRTVRSWLLASAAGVTVGYHFYGHYFLQLIPPAVLLALQGVGAACPSTYARRHRPWWTVRRAGRARTAAAAAGCALVVAGGWTVGALGSRPPEMETNAVVAAAVDTYSTPDQRVFLWGMHPEVYWLADRRPASRFLTAGLLTNFSGNGNPRRVGAAYAVPGAWPTLRRELAATPACLIVDESAGTPYRMADYPLLKNLLARNYDAVASVAGTRIYRRAGC